MTAALEVEALSFAYPGGRLALDDVSCSLDAGESVGLVGPNGAGKTSLFLCLAGVLAPRAGRVVVAGLDVRNPAQRKRLPGVVGIVFQDSDDQLFESSVAADVAFGPLNLGLPPDEVRRRAADALAQVGMTGHEDAPRVVCATRDIAASAERIFELIADPAQQPRWDGNDNLAGAPGGQRVRALVRCSP